MYELESDVVKVTDFGIARITDSSKTKTGMVLGTPSYMSPEQLQGKKIDGRSDLFSLAVSLYQLSCGKLSPQLVAFLDKAMAKEADQRHQTGEEFAFELRATFGGTGAAAGSTGVDITL